ncbi:metallophosphoesterase [Streptomyces sp. V3I7]|uniref:metallophosphoesterase n=1 Tax=Streptomyces sp. V3I7 TaxID=3042278 RepID=UPI00277D8BD9|nr:metallophosphoesterase [Streptomyces sp. V3I7]MDQ0992618.1 putative MPP superfamily phosphohydrolase/putative lipid-binding transport protein (Tim44 family) [Streptomyces sp. V3I7]
MVIVFVLVALAVLAAVTGLYWYVWRRLVRDTTAGPNRARRTGTAFFLTGPALMIGALVAERTGAPFWLQRVLAWPGFLWMACSLYLLLAVVAGEAVRPLLRRMTDRHALAVPAEAARAVPAGAAARNPAPIADAPAPAAETPASAAEAPASAVRPSASAAEAPASAAEIAAPAAETLPPAGEPPVPAADTAVPAAPAPPPTVDPPAPLAEAPASTHPESASAAPSRRLFVSRVVAGAAASAAVATVGVGTYGVLRGPGVKRVTVPLVRLPRAAHGFRIAVVSDIHLGPVLGRGFAQKVVDTVNATQPDLIAVVGDLVDGSVKDLGPAAAPLAQLSARHGAYFVTGNHEYFSGAEQWVEEVRHLGLHPLQNARTELPHFDLAGVNDVQGESEGQGPDFGRALGDRDTARACVLLAHQPVQIHESVRYGVDLQLSGHTHGGQLWPGNLIAAAANPTVAGLERYGDTQLYVSRGAGAWGPPTRVGAPSDITVIELASTRA